MRFLGWDGAIARARQINEVCIRLFGTVTFLSYAIIIHTLSLLYFYYSSKCCNICLSLQYFVHITISHCLLYDNGEFVAAFPALCGFDSESKQFKFCCGGGEPVATEKVCAYE